jgi:hypothetical protein
MFASGRLWPVDQITVEIPRQQLDALEQGLITSRAAIAEQAGRRARGDPSERGSPLELAALDGLLGQLGAPSSECRLTGEREPLRIATCDALVAAIEALGRGAHAYWRAQVPLAQLELDLDAVAECVQLLHRIEVA